jgi:transcription termination factor Rho
MHLNELKALHVSEVLKQAEALEIENTGRMRKQELMFAIIKKRAKAGEQVNADGVLEVLPDGFGFLRNMDTSFTASTDDIYISPSQIRRFNLHTGDMIEGEVRIPKDGERYFALNKLDAINGLPPESNKHKVMFENLTPLFPKEQMRLERDIKTEENITGRVIDIIAPIGKGQRALIVAPPKSGKTVMMQHICHAIAANHPEVELMVLLVDERPEEVTEMQRTVRGDVIASTFDEPGRTEKRRGDPAGLDHPPGSRLQQRAAQLRQGADWRRGRQRPAAPQALLRCCAQRGRRRLADHHRHRPGRHRQPHGRGDL